MLAIAVVVTVEFGRRGLSLRDCCPRRLHERARRRIVRRDERSGEVLLGDFCDRARWLTTKHGRWSARTQASFLCLPGKEPES